RRERRDPRGRVLQLPPVLHGQAEDPRHRRPGRALRAALQEEGRQEVGRKAAYSDQGRPGETSRGSPGRSESAPGGRRGPRDRDGPGHSVNLDDLISEYASIEERLADPSVHADQGLARKLGKRYAELRPIIETHRELVSTQDDLAAARELAEEDGAFAAEAEELEERRAELEERLRRLLVPRDPNDSKDVILEIKAGEGGEESALFAADL